MRDPNEKEIARLSPEEKNRILDTIAKSPVISDLDFQILKIISYDSFAVLRAKVAEILNSFNNREGESMLIRLLHDKDDLVRAEACKSLQNSTSAAVLPLLMERAKHDKADLVRGYAATSLASILISTNPPKKNYIDYFYKLVETENIKWVKIHLYKALYILGETVFLYKLLDELNNRVIKERAAVVNLLEELVTDENREIIKIALLQALKEERTVLVKNMIEKVLNNL
ncbi:MAG: HEAT repeat domain-containing protein [Bacillota bacterium]|nr:HEAT repeat domain-containing protein [Bacillota bacterium]